MIFIYKETAMDTKIYKFNPPLVADFRTKDGSKLFKRVLTQIDKLYPGILWSDIPLSKTIKDNKLYNDDITVYNFVIWRDGEGNLIMDYNLDMRPGGNPYIRYSGEDNSSSGTESGWGLIYSSNLTDKVIDSMFEGYIKKIIKESLLS